MIEMTPCEVCGSELIGMTSAEHAKTAGCAMHRVVRNAHLRGLKNVPSIHHTVVRAARAPRWFRSIDGLKPPDLKAPAWVSALASVYLWREVTLDLWRDHLFFCAINPIAAHTLEAVAKLGTPEGVARYLADTPPFGIDDSAPPVFRVCSCGRAYTFSQWWRLAPPPKTIIDGGNTTPDAVQCIHRNCACSSTMTIDLEGEDTRYAIDL